MARTNGRAAHNALVATGAALFVVITALTRGDNSPTRIAAQVVTGVGFLGAGVIIRDGGQLRGINTAATIWCAAAVGAEASIGAALIIAANVVLRPVARRVDREPLSDDSEVYTAYHLHATCRDEDEPRIRAQDIESLRKTPPPALISISVSAPYVEHPPCGGCPQAPCS